MSNPDRLHTHDCTTCVFLGSYMPDIDNSLSGKYDLYWCPNEPSVIARFGSKGPEYMSGLEIALRYENQKRWHPLVIALVLARTKGLYKDPPAADCTGP